MPSRRGGWYCFGEYDGIFIFEAPNNEAMSAIAMAMAAGGALKASKTTSLMSGAEGVAAMRQAKDVLESTGNFNRPIFPPTSVGRGR